MKVEYFKEYSNCLNREMEFKIYGHTGIPLLVFPAQDGRFYDCLLYTSSICLVQPQKR